MGELSPQKGISIPYDYTDWDLVLHAIHDACYRASLILVFDEDQVAVRIFRTAAATSRVKYELHVGVTKLTLW